MTTEQEVELLELYGQNITGLVKNVHRLVELSAAYEEQFRRLWVTIAVLSLIVLGLSIRTVLG